MKRFGCLFVLMALLVLSSCTDDDGLQKCAKACKESGTTLQEYSYGNCRCHNPVEVKFGTSK